MKKILLIVLFCVLILLLLIPYLTLISTYFHEKAHVDTASKYGINLTYKPEIITRIISFYSELGPAPSGESKFNTENDKRALCDLEMNNRKEILMAGIISDTNISYLLLTVAITLTTIVFTFYYLDIKGIILKHKFGKKGKYFLMLLDMIILFWLSWMVRGMLLNLNLSPCADANFIYNCKYCLQIS